MHRRWVHACVRACTCLSLRAQSGVHFAYAQNAPPLGCLDAFSWRPATCPEDTVCLLRSNFLFASKRHCNRLALQRERWNMWSAVFGWLRWAPQPPSRSSSSSSTTLIADCLSRRIMDIIDRLLGGRVFVGRARARAITNPFVRESPSFCGRGRRYISSVCVCPGHTLRGRD